MATTIIPWGDGSGGNIYLTYPSASGDQTVQVSSDANSGNARTKVVTFSAPGVSPVSLTVNQSAALPYSPVEYIETDGTAYIRTNVAGNAPRSFEGKMLPICPASSSGSSYFLGCRKDSSTNTRFWAFSVYGTKKAAFGYYSGYYANVDISDSIDNQTPLEFHSVLQNGTCRVGVKQQGESSYTDYTRNIAATITTSYYMCLFAVSNGGTIAHSLAGTRCYWVKIYNSNNYTNLVFDGVPCYYNGEYGIWDMVSNTFFGNVAGSGAFTGPAI